LAKFYADQTTGKDHLFSPTKVTVAPKKTGGTHKTTARAFCQGKGESGARSPSTSATSERTPTGRGRAKRILERT
jgi:hypothetical protein